MIKSKNTILAIRIWGHILDGVVADLNMYREIKVNFLNNWSPVTHNLASTSQ